MTYVFLIFMIGAGVQTDKHIVPMESRAQCEAAILANSLYQEEENRPLSARVNEIKCVEVRR